MFSSSAPLGEVLMHPLNRPCHLPRLRAAPRHRCVQGGRAEWERCAARVDTDKEMHKLFTQLALRYRDRPGGFTRVVKCGFRPRDGAVMAYVE